MLNKVHLIGYVGKDPEVRMCPDGSTLLKFSVATSDNFVTKNKEKKVITEWHQIKLFNTNEFLRKGISKGKLVYVEGKLKTESYTTNNNENRKVVTVYAYNVRILSEKSQINEDKQPSSPNIHLNGIPYFE